MLVPSINVTTAVAACTGAATAVVPTTARAAPAAARQSGGTLSAGPSGVEGVHPCRFAPVRSGTPVHAQESSSSAVVELGKVTANGVLDTRLRHSTSDRRTIESSICCPY